MSGALLPVFLKKHSS